MGSSSCRAGSLGIRLYSEYINNDRIRNTTTMYPQRLRIYLPIRHPLKIAFCFFPIAGNGISLFFSK